MTIDCLFGINQNLRHIMGEFVIPPPPDIRDTMSNLYSLPVDQLRQTEGAIDDFLVFRAALEQGEIRAAQRNRYGIWITDPRVKQGILVGFRLGDNVSMSNPEETLQFVDKRTYPVRSFRHDDGVRLVPGGTSVRSGAYVGEGVVIMPPAYVNVGAYVGNETMIDSHALVGSCAQVGERCHISAGAQIGGVLEPINANPCIIEDRVVMGANSSIVEGVILREGVVLGSGVNLTSSTPVFDLVNETIHRSMHDSPLIIPEGAVVVQGSRRLDGNMLALDYGLSITVPIIKKYRDKKTDAKTALEEALR